MKADNDKILEVVVKNLLETTNVSWEMGDLDDWTKWARRMKQAILNNTEILKTLIENDEK